MKILKPQILKATDETCLFEILITSPSWKKALENQPAFEEVRQGCEELKNKALEDPEYSHDEFKINDATLWNPYYLMTERFLTS